MMHRINISPDIFQAVFKRLNRLLKTLVIFKVLIFSVQPIQAQTPSFPELFTYAKQEGGHPSTNTLKVTIATAIKAYKLTIDNSPLTIKK